MRNALSGVERALFWTLAFAAFAAAAAGLAARGIDRLAVGYDDDRHSYAIVRVLSPEGPAGIAAAEAALTHSPHVSAAAPMTANRAAALLRQWGGSNVNAEDLPPLRLIELEVEPGGPNVDVAGDIIASLAQGGVTADFVQAPESASGGGVVSRIRLAALWGASAFALVMAIIVSLAARSLAARKRDLVSVMADLGATRTQAAGRIADEAAVLGLYAGLAGGVLAGVVAVLVLLAIIPHATLAMLPRIVLPVDLAPIVAAPLGTAIAAGMGARAAAGFFHGQAARLA